MMIFSLGLIVMIFVLPCLIVIIFVLNWCDDISPALIIMIFLLAWLWWYFSWPDCDDICELVDMTRSAGNWFINKSQMFLHWYIFLSSLLSAPGKTKIQTQPSAFPHSALGNTFIPGVVVGARSGRNDRNEPLIALKAPPLKTPLFLSALYASYNPNIVHCNNSSIDAFPPDMYQSAPMSKSKVQKTDNKTLRYRQNLQCSWERATPF